MSHVRQCPPKTAEDLRTLPEEVRAELIDGEIDVTPSPSDAHQRASLGLVRQLDRWAQRTRAGVLRSAPLDVHLDTGDVVRPDIVFVSQGRSCIVGGDGIHGAPDLVLEIVARSNPERDRYVKRAIDATGGVGEYWIVDPDARDIEALCLEAGSFVPAGWYRDGDALVSATFPRLRFPVTDVFDADGPSPTRP